MEQIEWNALIGPAVIAAVIAGIISVITSVITLLVNRATTLTTHSQRLTFDSEQAERRGNAEIALAERRGNAEIALAERKITLDRELADWKRRTEIAEQMLADFYKARTLSCLREIRTQWSAKVLHAIANQTKRMM